MDTARGSRVHAKRRVCSTGHFPRPESSASHSSRYVLGAFASSSTFATSPSTPHKPLKHRPNPPPDMAESTYTTEYRDAVCQFRADQYDDCIALARYTLTDLTLPRDHRMKNLLLIAWAENDWYEAERCRREAWEI